MDRSNEGDYIMGHMVEGLVSYVEGSEVPWHDLARQLPKGLTAEEWLKRSELDWEVSKVPLHGIYRGKMLQAKSQLLVRGINDANGKLQKATVLTEVSEDWEPVQNSEAFDFFEDFIKAGDMEMETAGSLRGGQVVFATARLKDSGFELFGGDEIRQYFQFANWHRYGFALDIRTTGIRTVCNNTLQLSLNDRGATARADAVFRQTHRKAFDPEYAKMMLGIAKKSFADFKEKAGFLGSKRFTAEEFVEYVAGVFPTSGEKAKKNELSNPAKATIAALEIQDGNQFARGSWWQAFNAVTFTTDHKLFPNNDEKRAFSAMFGPNKDRKIAAFDLALKMAA